MARKKVGLALGGGAARGLAHIGVLEVLEKEGVPVDVVSGTSAGAIFGALHAAGISAVSIRKAVLGLDWKQWARMLDITIPRSGFISGKRLINEITTIMGGNLKFSDLKKPFACVACDIETGEEAVMNGGSVAEAIHASISIPIIFRAVRRGGRLLVDGGLVNQVPVSVVRNMGADYVIAVNVVPRYAHTRPTHLDDMAIPETDRHSKPGLISIMLNVIDIATCARVEVSLQGADTVIETNTLDIGPADFRKAELAVLRGEWAAVDAVAKIKKDLGLDTADARGEEA
ncbi:MAG: patatin-like phospholipase family protein [Dehalococcoidia bacterium]|nr:patatin-like phospholipase family protein [Dehalococcoidia bacterium]